MKVIITLCGNEFSLLSPLFIPSGLLLTGETEQLHDGMDMSIYPEAFVLGIFRTAEGKLIVISFKYDGGWDSVENVQAELGERLEDFSIVTDGEKKTLAAVG